MVENDIIDATDRSRLPLMTTKVTPSAITPRMAEDRTTPMTLSMPRNRLFAIAKPIMNSTKATRIPCRARNWPSILSRFSAISLPLPFRPEPVVQTSVMPPSIITIWPVM